jgi:hypothetical protein
MSGIYSLFAVFPLVLATLIVWHVISSLNEIRRGVTDIAVTLRRLEAKGSPALPATGGQPDPL